jgi:hypothetical protein
MSLLLFILLAEPIQVLMSLTAVTLLLVPSTGTLSPRGGLPCAVIPGHGPSAKPSPTGLRFLVLRPRHPLGAACEKIHGDDALGGIPPIGPSRPWSTHGHDPAIQRFLMSP